MKHFLYLDRLHPLYEFFVSFWQGEHENHKQGCGGTVNSMGDYVEAVIWRCYTEVYLECSRTSMMELLCSFEQRVQKVFLEISAKSMKAIGYENLS